MEIINKTLDLYTENTICKNFYIYTLSSETLQDNLHRHNFYQIVILRKGKMRHWIDFEAKELTAPSISILFPYQIHRMTLSEDAQIDIIMFDKTVFCSELLANELKEYNINLQNKLNFIENIPVNTFSEVESCYEQILSLRKDINMARKMQIKFLIKLILLKMIDLTSTSNKSIKSDLDISTYIRFRENLDNNYSKQLKVQDYADELGITTKKLNNICLKYTGITPLEIIHEKLTLELKKTFVSEDILLKEIAYRFNFSSQSALNKFIERQFKCSPNELRAVLEKNILGKNSIGIKSIN